MVSCRTWNGGTGRLRELLSGGMGARYQGGCQCTGLQAGGEEGRTCASEGGQFCCLMSWRRTPIGARPPIRRSGVPSHGGLACQGWRRGSGHLAQPGRGHALERVDRPGDGHGVIRDAAGRYFASFVIQADPAADAQRFCEADGEVGIDLGLTASPSCRTAPRSALRGFCAGPRRSSAGRSRHILARRKVARTGRSPGPRWPGSMLRSRTSVPTSTTRHPP
jgi:hypothetical protein